MPAGAGRAWLLALGQRAAGSVLRRSRKRESGRDAGGARQVGAQRVLGGGLAAQRAARGARLLLEPQAAADARRADCAPRRAAPRAARREPLAPGLPAQVTRWQSGAGAHSCGRTPAAAASPGRSSGRWSTAPGCPARTAACARGSPAGSRAPPAVTSRTHAHHHHRAAPDAIAARRVVPAKALPAIESCPRPSLFEQVSHCRTRCPGFKACHQEKSRGQI